MSPPDGDGPKATSKPASKPREPAPPLLSPTGFAPVDSVADVVNRTANPFMNAPDPEGGAAGWVAHTIGAVTGVIGMPADLIDTAFASLTGPIADLFPAMSACTLGAIHVGPPHCHTHPPSLIPPAPPVPLPSIGNVLGAGAVTVLLCGVPAARAGDIGISVTCGSLAPPFEIFTGSSNVFIGGSRAARWGDITKHCNPTSMGKFDVAMGAAGVVAGAAGAIATGNAYMAAQAAADAAVLAFKMLCGKDPAAPPGMGVLLGPPVASVKIGGFPCPPVGEMAVGAIMKKLKAAVKALKSIRNTRRVNAACGNASHPIYLPTGENFDSFVDFVSGGLFEWRRHVTSARAKETGPHGHGWRHYYQRSLSVRLHRAVFTDWDGQRYEFPRFHRGSDVVRGDGYVLRRIRRGRYTLQHRDQPVMEFHGGEFEGELPLVRITDANFDLQLAYDEHGQLCRAEQWERGNGRERRRWSLKSDDRGRITEVAEHEAGVVAAFAYDDQGHLVRAKDAMGGVSRYAYDPFHRVAQQADARGYAYAFEYDVWGRCTKASGADGLWECTVEYFPEDGFTRYTEGDGAPYECHYAPDGFIHKIVDPYGGETKRERDAQGRVIREVDAGGRALLWLYDEDDAHFARVDRFGYVHPPEEEVAFLGNPLARDLPATAAQWLYARTPAPRAPSVDTDALGRRTKETDARGRTRSWAYDATSNVTSVRDRDGRVHTRKTTSWNLVGERRDPLGNAMQYRYSKLEQVTGIVDPLGTTSRYEYDFAERLVRVHRDGRLREEYVYENDHFVEKRDGDGNVLFRNEIHANHEVAVRRLASGGEHRFDYDGAGRITEASTAEHEVIRSFDDDEGRIVDFRDGVGVVHRDGRTRVFDRFELACEADAPGAIALRDPSGRSTRLHYTVDGTVRRECASGTVEEAVYDEDGNLVAQTVQGARSTWAVRYAYSAHGDLLRVQDTVRGSTVYEVDAAHRLVAETGPTGARQAFRLDEAGNVLSKPGLPRVEVGRANRLTASGTEIFEYDRRDRLAARRRPDGSEARYVYDSFDLLVGVEGRWSAGYDAVGRRLWSEANGARRDFYWDGDRLAAEVFPEGGFRIYQYAGHEALVPIGFVDYDSVDADPGSGRSYQVFSNQVGMPLCIEDADGSVVWWAERIDPYGAIEIRAGAQLEYNLRWPGHYFDAATGLHYNRYRYYDPTLGRYLQSDPLGYEGSEVNLYAYCENPLVTVDILGLEHAGRRNKSRRGSGDSDGREDTPVPQRTKRVRGPPRGADELGSDGLTANQRKYFRKRIDAAEAADDKKAAAQARYDRNRRKRANKDPPQKPMDPKAWAKSADLAADNRVRGTDDERAALKALDIENNNSRSDGKTIQQYGKGDGKTRPDGDTNQAVIDVKSMPDTPDANGRPRKLNNSPQLKAQQKAATDSERQPVVIMTNKKRDNVAPSKVLADQGPVFHRNSENGNWSEWNGVEWKDTSKDAVKAQLQDI